MWLIDEIISTYQTAMGMRVDIDYIVIVCYYLLEKFI